MQSTELLAGILGDLAIGEAQTTQLLLSSPWAGAHPGSGHPGLYVVGSGAAYIGTDEGPAVRLEVGRSPSFARMRRRMVTATWSGEEAARSCFKRSASVSRPPRRGSLPTRSKQANAHISGSLRPTFGKPSACVAKRFERATPATVPGRPDTEPSDHSAAFSSAVSAVTAWWTRAVAASQRRPGPVTQPTTTSSTRRTTTSNQIRASRAAGGRRPATAGVCP